MNREQKVIKDILSDWQDYDKNLFHQSVKMALRQEELRKLEELGSATRHSEADMRFLQGEIAALKKIQKFSDKHKGDLIKQK